MGISAFRSANEVGRLCGSGDEEDPDVGVKFVVFVMAAQAQVVECVFRGQFEGVPDDFCNQTI